MSLKRPSGTVRFANWRTFRSAVRRTIGLVGASLCASATRSLCQLQAPRQRSVRLSNSLLEPRNRRNAKRHDEPEQANSPRMHVHAGGKGAERQQGQNCEPVRADAEDPLNAWQQHHIHHHQERDTSAAPASRSTPIGRLYRWRSAIRRRHRPLRSQAREAPNRPRSAAWNSWCRQRRAASGSIPRHKAVL